MQKENYNERQEMSFSGKIKEELARQWSDARHCQIAELAAISVCAARLQLIVGKNIRLK